MVSMIIPSSTEITIYLYNVYLMSASCQFSYYEKEKKKKTTIANR